MRTSTLLALGLGLGLGLLVSVPVDAAVFGEDERDFLYPSEESTFNFIQLVETNDGFVSTGFIVGKKCDIVITNAHALYDGDIFKEFINGRRDNPGKWHDTLKYFPNPKSGKYINATLKQHGFVHNKPDIGENDWAILQLDKPAKKNCNSIELDYKSNSCKGDLLVVGHHFDSLDRKMISVCKYFNFNNKLIKHSCDVKRGSSGSPIICNYKAKNKIIGIVGNHRAPRGYIDPMKKGVSSTLNYGKYFNIGILFKGEFLNSLKEKL